MDLWIDTRQLGPDSNSDMTDSKSSFTSSGDTKGLGSDIILDSADIEKPNGGPLSASTDLSPSPDQNGIFRDSPTTAILAVLVLLTIVLWIRCRRRKSRKLDYMRDDDNDIVITFQSQDWRQTVTKLHFEDPHLSIEDTDRTDSVESSDVSTCSWSSSHPSSPNRPTRKGNHSATPRKAVPTILQRLRNNTATSRERWLIEQYEKVEEEAQGSETEVIVFGATPDSNDNGAQLFVEDSLAYSPSFEIGAGDVLASNTAIPQPLFPSETNNIGEMDPSHEFFAV